MSGSKRYYWLKLFDTFFDDPKVKKLKRLAGGDGYIVILLRFMLLTIKSNGVYKYQGLEITLAKELELILDEQEEHIQAVLIYLEKTGMLKEISQSSFLLTDVPKMLGSETTTAERMRKSRAKKRKKKKQINLNVTMLHHSYKMFQTVTQR
ncbi:MAG: phage replisome organizer N-terminal domain-containing protein [Sulfurovaceae bacterium]